MPLTRASKSSSSSSSSPTNKFQVYEFSDDEEQIEKASKKYVCKFLRPRIERDSPVSKYTFLQSFARGAETLGNESKSELIKIDSETLAKENKSELIDVDSEEETEYLQKETSNTESSVDASFNAHPGIYTTSCFMNASLHENTEQISLFGDSLQINSNFGSEPHVMLSDDGNTTEFGSLSSTSTSSSSECKVSFEDQLLVHGSDAYKMENSKMMVRVFPDFVLYGDIHSTASLLIFSSSCIKLEGLTMNATGQILSYEWRIDSINRIDSCWFERVKTAMITLLLEAKGSLEASKVNQNPGFEKLNFAVYDPCWSKTEEAIKSLAGRYKDVWNVILEIRTENEGCSVSFGKDCFSSNPYLPFLTKTFEDFVYPQGDPDAVSISKRDIELLQPDKFINDTIIDLYVKYLKNKIPPDEQHKFHFFNSFFFRKLADLDKDPSSACDGRRAFQRVRKWTRKVNLFEKDYIFIPVNYSLHWSLIVICHPGKVISFKYEEIENSPQVPCILHMNSLEGSHRGLKNVFQSYLYEEWKERYGEAEDNASKFLELKFVPLELPQQENLYDCGLFLLHYMELFLEEAPMEFSPFKITEFSNFLNRNWFLPAEASLKRVHIQRLIYEILEDNSQKALPAVCTNKIPSFHDVKDKVRAECLEVVYPSTIDQESPIADLGIENPFPAAAPSRGLQHFRELRFMKGDLLQKGAVGRSFRDVGCPQIMASKRGFMSPIQEVEENEEETANLSPDMNNVCEVAASTSEFPSNSCLSKDFTVMETPERGYGVHSCQNNEQNSLYETMDKEPLKSIEKTCHNRTLQQTSRSDLPCNADTYESSLTSRHELAACVVEDSEDREDVDIGDQGKNTASSFEGEIICLLNECDNWDYSVFGKDDTSIVKEAFVLESDEPDSKKPRLMHPGGKRRFTRSVVKEVHA